AVADPEHRFLPAYKPRGSDNFRSARHAHRDHCGGAVASGAYRCVYSWLILPAQTNAPVQIMSLQLNSASRQALKRQAHHLKPIVQTGARGLTSAVTAEVDRALFDHELVKIRLVA